MANVTCIYNFDILRSNDLEGIKSLIKHWLLEEDESELAKLYQEAKKFRQVNYDNRVYLRALVEVSSYCKQNCHYCGLNCHSHARRYRLDKETIISSCQLAYDFGFRTFVLQGGEDEVFQGYVVDVVKEIRKRFPDVAITLSLGELSDEQYRNLKNAGANRYLLRHETADEEHFSKLHGHKQTFASRYACLKKLKELGYQTGCGMMVGSPYQSIDNLVKDFLLLKELQPEMVGLGPFISSDKTIFRDFANGDINLVVKVLALVRIMLPEVLLPATTALATLDESVRVKALQVSANVMMPNFTPLKYQASYSLYDNKKNTGMESGVQIENLKTYLANNNLLMDLTIGNHKRFERKDK